jgi:protein-L-isoaspartate O-methyltransferase
MIDSQLRTSGVNEPYVLAAMARVARERFRARGLRDAAYIDRAMPLGNGRFCLPRWSMARCWPPPPPRRTTRS